MTPERLAKMQEGRRAAADARRAEQEQLASDEDAHFRERHQRARQDLMEARGPEWMP